MNNSDFKKRFLPFHSLVYRVAHAILENRDDAEDIAQEVYIKLWEQREKLTDIRSDEAFVITLTKHLSIDLQRTNRRKSASTIENGEIAGESQEQQIDARDELLNLRKCLKTLPEAQQKAIRLRHFADMSITEIARQTQQSEVNVRQLLSRARRTMKEILNRDTK